MISNNNQSSTPKRRWWQRILRPRFSMRTMMIVMTLFCVIVATVGNWVYRSEKQRRAVAIIEQPIPEGGPGAQVMYEDENTARERASIFHPLTWMPISWQEKLGKDYFYDVEYIHMGWYPQFAYMQFFSEEAKAHVFSQLPQFENLSGLLLVSVPKLSPDDIRQIKKLHKLNSISIYQMDQDLSLLAELTSLKQLSLVGVDVSIEELKKLEPLNQLNGFTFLNTIDHHDAAMKTLDERFFAQLVTQFPELKTLGIGTPTDVNYLKPLSYHPRLKHIQFPYISQSQKISESEIRAILPNITVEILPK